MPVILETKSQILKYVNVGVDELNVRYGMRFVYSEDLSDDFNSANFHCFIAMWSQWVEVFSEGELMFIFTTCSLSKK